LLIWIVLDHIWSCGFVDVCFVLCGLVLGCELEYMFAMFDGPVSAELGSVDLSFVHLWLLRIYKRCGLHRMSFGELPARVGGVGVHFVPSRRRPSHQWVA
jgi:hypothetical protein